MVTRRPFADLPEVEEAYPRFVSLTGPFTATELIEEVETFYVPPRKDLSATRISRRFSSRIRWRSRPNGRTKQLVPVAPCR